MSKRLIFTVTSDISFDQRMDRICSSLSRNGFDVTILGRRTADSLSVAEKPYRCVRFKNFFKAGKIFYIEHNLKLLFYLLFKKVDIICSIDLDTIVPGYLAAKIRSKPFVYDAHEYFPEQAQVVNRPLTKKIWTFVEEWIVPKVKYAYRYHSGVVAYAIYAQDEVVEETAEETSPLSFYGSVDAYYRKPFDGGMNQAPTTSFANASNFAIGMVNLGLEMSGEKTGFVGDLVFGPRGDDAVFGSILPSGNDAIVNQLYAYWNVSDAVTLTLGNFNFTKI